KRGRLAGERPSPKAVAAIRDGRHPAKGAASAKVPFHLVAWTAIERDGSLRPADRSNTSRAEHWIRMEGIPRDIPATGTRASKIKERVLLLQKAPPATRAVPVAPSFESLPPNVKVSEELSSAEVRRTLLRLGAAAAPAPNAPAKAKAKTAARPKKAARTISRG